VFDRHTMSQQLQRPSTHHIEISQHNLRSRVAPIS